MNNLCWECPICQTSFDEKTIPVLLKKLEEWLSNRPSATMDPSYEKAIQIMNIVKILKSIQMDYIQRDYVRPPSKMMESQIIENDDNKEK